MQSKGVLHASTALDDHTALERQSAQRGELENTCES